MESARVSGCADRLGLDRLEIFEPELQLVDLAGEPLGRLAELHAPEPCQLDLELLDLQRGQLNGGLGRAELGSGAGQFVSSTCQRCCSVDAGLLNGLQLLLQCLREGAQLVWIRGEIGRDQRHGSSYHRRDSGQAKRTEKHHLYERWRGRRSRRYSAPPVNAFDQ